MILQQIFLIITVLLKLARFQILPSHKWNHSLLKAFLSISWAHGLIKDLSFNRSVRDARVPISHIWLQRAEVILRCYLMPLVILLLLLHLPPQSLQIKVKIFCLDRKIDNRRITISPSTFTLSVPALARPVILELKTKVDFWPPDSGTLSPWVWDLCTRCFPLRKLKLKLFRLAFSVLRLLACQSQYVKCKEIFFSTAWTLYVKHLFSNINDKAHSSNLLLA